MQKNSFSAPIRLAHFTRALANEPINANDVWLERT